MAFPINVFLDEPNRVIEYKNILLAEYIVDDVFVYEGSRVHDNCVLEGPSFIGPGCQIGPFAHIRPGTYLQGNNRIGRSEIKNSIMLEGASAPHFNYVGDSILGNNVNLGAGTKIANQRINKESIRVDGEGYEKFGAILGNDVRTGINVSIYPGEIIDHGSYVYMDLDTGKRVIRK